MRRFVSLAAFLALAIGAGCGKKTESSVGSDDPSRMPPAPKVVTDKDRFQGVWVAEAVETDKGPKELKPDRVPRLQVEGDRVSLRESATDPGEPFSAAWDEAKSPKGLALTPFGPDGKPRPGAEPQMWIYKFEGEKLVVAFGFGPAPTEFKPDAKTGVSVMRFAKTTEQPVELAPRARVARVRAAPGGNPRVGGDRSWALTRGRSRGIMRTIALAALVALVGCSKNTPTARDTTERDRLRGVWAVESVECGVELSAPARQRMMDSRLHVHENRFTLGTGDQWEFYTFAVDGGQEPKKLLLHETGPGGLAPATKGIPKPPRAKGWIYKFEGEKLVLAFLRDDSSASVPPPADFKTEPGQNVMVLRLVKTNEEPRTQWDAKPPAGPAKK